MSHGLPSSDNVRPCRAGRGDRRQRRPCRLSPCRHLRSPHVRAQMESVSASHKAIAYDRRGFGETRAEKEDHSAVADLMAVIDALTSGTPAVLVACSQGGRIAIDAALRHPSAVRALVLISPTVTGAPEATYPPDIKTLMAELKDAEQAGDQLIAPPRRRHRQPRRPAAGRSRRPWRGWRPRTPPGPRPGSSRPCARAPARVRRRRAAAARAAAIRAVGHRDEDPGPGWSRGRIHGGALLLEMAVDLLVVLILMRW